MSDSKFKISLRENGEHSFKRGLESYKDYEKTRDQMFLKDAIMFLHHGIELLMKEFLVRHSPYLIFEDLRDIPKKQKRADELQVGIFFLDPPPKTVTYDVAISRVDAFIKPLELNDELLKNLEELNRLRNQLEHYAIEVDTDKVTRIFATIHNPLLKLFETHIGPLKQLETPSINQTWSTIQDVYQEQQRLNREIISLIKSFNGQKIPGYLLGNESEIILPKFHQILEDRQILENGVRIEVDALAESEELSEDGQRIRWLVEIKNRRATSEALHMVVSNSLLAQARPWLVAFGNIPAHMREKAKGLNAMISGATEIQSLKALLEIS